MAGVHLLASDRRFLFGCRRCLDMFQLSFQSAYQSGDVQLLCRCLTFQFFELLQCRFLLAAHQCKRVLKFLNLPLQRCGIRRAGFLAQGAEQGDAHNRFLGIAPGRCAPRQTERVPLFVKKDKVKLGADVELTVLFEIGSNVVARIPQGLFLVATCDVPQSFSDHGICP
jgi:hypothetical protein